MATEVANSIGLKNVNAVHRRGEEERGRYDFVVSRAVMPMPDLVKIIRKNIDKKNFNVLANGLICLKGGNLYAELEPFKKTVEQTEITEWFKEAWFKEKYVIYVPL